MKIMAGFFLWLFFAVPLHAQMHKGQWLLGGEATYSHTTTDNDPTGYSQHITQSSYSVLPVGGYFIIDRLAAGIRVNLVYSKTKENSHGDNPLLQSTYSAQSSTSAYGAGPFVRYYLLKPAAKLNVFAEAAYMYSSEKSKSSSVQVVQYQGQPPSASSYTSESKYKVNYFSFSAGPVLMLGPKVSLEITAGYTIGKVHKENQTSGQLSLGTGFVIFL